MTKSIAPNSFIHLLAASSRLLIFLTSTDPIPTTLAPFRAVAIFFAIDSVFSTFRPMIHAFAPR
jgi:small basic protein